MDESGDIDINQPRLGGFEFDEPLLEEPAVDRFTETDKAHQPADPGSRQGNSQQLDLLSDPYIGRWERLVSSTNWEKGRIILEWREALVSGDAPVSEYSDEAWSRRVGTVTGQHAGRLRRISQRFGTIQLTFDGLCWSHFQAAIDWDDAEMWLEGALQSNWSVSKMRQHRWETLGGRLTDRPRDEDIVIAELDEDCDPARSELVDPIDPTITPVYDHALSGPLHEGPDFGEEDVPSSQKSSALVAAHEVDAPAGEPVTLVSPFRNVENLPGDLGQAVEAFKLAILRHKAAGWQETSCDSVLTSLEALKQLAQAPSDDQGQG